MSKLMWNKNVRMKLAEQGIKKYGIKEIEINEFTTDIEKEGINKGITLFIDNTKIDIENVKEELLQDLINYINVWFNPFDVVNKEIDEENSIQNRINVSFMLILFAVLEIKAISEGKSGFLEHKGETANINIHDIDDITHYIQLFKNNIESDENEKIKCKTSIALQ